MESVVHHTEDLSLNAAIVRKLLVDFLRDEIHGAGFRKGVLGLSGGIDSTVAAYLAAEALGKENVLGVIMPYRTSNPQSRVDAERVAASLGIQTEVVDITPMVDPLLERGKILDPVRAGNIMARQRMIILYDYSHKEAALVIGTSNKTEIFLGYGTLFGDTASALNPLGDLYKTQVWQLARALNVPQNIIDKKPSADLWEGQTDEGELGFTYTQADHLLYNMIDERRSESELVAMGFQPEFVRTVKDKVKKSQFKRRPPLIAKISHRTVNVDFRYPRDWGM
ncbi:MAG: NH(3)-dependent synthetase [Bacteroidetes bacterium]|nr:NH(3)-dependent synthetase [Bacteroidota bacterium]